MQASLHRLAQVDRGSDAEVAEREPALRSDGDRRV
jgi:hypothetical protein